jgi:hypothetical protein
MPQDLADQSEHEWLRDTHDGEVVPGVTDLMDVAARTHNADAEQVTGDTSQSWIDLGILPLGVRREFLIRLGHQRTHEIRWGKVPGRHITGRGSLPTRFV